MRRRSGSLAVAAVAAVVWSVLSPTAAGAVHVTCGAVITQDTVLDSDVGPCPLGGGWGIQVAANDVTLDLNGHTVFANEGPGEGAGIYLFRTTGVTVRNGTVRGFDGGVAIEGGSANTVTGLTVRDNIGIVATSRYADGIAILSSQNNRIARNTVIHNGPLAGIGVYTVVNAEHLRTTSGVSRGNLIDGNVVLDHTPARGPTINDNDGIRIETQSVFNTISNNLVRGSGLDGIAIFSFAPDNVIRNNSVHDNGFLNPFRRRGDGIRVFGGSARTVVENNRVTGNAANGIIFHGVFNTPSGPRPPVTDSRAIRNLSIGNNLLPPLEQSELGGPTFDLHDGNPNCDNNVWFANTYRTAHPPCTTTGGQQA